MIFDKISNFKRYSSMFPEIYKYITTVDITNLELGKHVINENLFVLVNEYQSNQPINRIFENHHKYIDIQLVASGIERIEYTNANTLKLSKSYDNENDYELYEVNEPVNSINLESNNFCIFFPGEAHQPGLAVENVSVFVKKFVFKVKV